MSYTACNEHTACLHQENLTLNHVPENMHVCQGNASENAHFTSFILSNLYQTRIDCNCDNYTQRKTRVIEINKMQLHTAWIKHIFKQTKS